jgi:hypothetical protein
MTKNNLQSLMEKLQAVETETHIDSELMNMLERRGRSCIGANYINKAKAAAMNAKNDKEFLDNLTKSIRMLKIEGNDVYMVYPRCYCHKLKDFKGDVPASYCYCSVGWVKEMFEQALGRAIEVRLEASVRRGDKTCRLKVLI